MKNRIGKLMIVLAIFALSNPINANTHKGTCITDTGLNCKDWVQTTLYCFCFSTLTGDKCGGWDDGETQHVYCTPIPQ